MVFIRDVVQERATATRQRLIQAATDLIRRKGYIATTIDDICEHSKVTKGAFFHHFKTKEDLAEACLKAWDCQTAAMEQAAPFQAIQNPRKRVLGYLDFFAGLFDDPKTLKSCLAGTTAQEVSETNPVLRDGASVCFQNAQKRFQALLDEACKAAPRPVDTAGLASLWMAAVQGSLILSKASQDEVVIRRNLDHVKQYISGFLPPEEDSESRPC